MIAQEILDDLWQDGGAGGPVPATKYQRQLEGLIENLLAEGFIFYRSTSLSSDWGTIISPADDDAATLFEPYKSGPKFNNIMEMIFDEYSLS